LNPKLVLYLQPLLFCVDAAPVRLQLVLLSLTAAAVNSYSVWRVIMDSQHRSRDTYSAGSVGRHLDMGDGK